MSLIEDIIRRTLQHFKDQQSQPSVILMTTRRYHECQDYFQPRCTTRIEPLSQILGMDIEHFATMSDVYARAGELTRQQRHVAILYDRCERPFDWYKPEPADNGQAE